MIFGVPKEIKSGENRVGLTPAGVKYLLSSNGNRVFVESGAGKNAGFSDEEYREAGATLVYDNVYRAVEVIVKVKELQKEEYKYLRKGLTLFQFLHLATEKEFLDLLLEKEITGIDLAAIKNVDGAPHIVKPMSEIAGMLAAQLGAHYLASPSGNGKLVGQIGDIQPPLCIIFGAGNVGRNAALMANKMGARVIALDTNESLVTKLNAEYAHLSGVVFLPYKNISLREFLKEGDIFIGAAIPNINGLAAKVLKKEDLKYIKPKSVLIDVAIDQGGCFESSVVTTHGNPTRIVEEIIHYGVTNIPSLAAHTASLALEKEHLQYLRQLSVLPLDKLAKHDSLLRGGICTYKGCLYNKTIADIWGMQSELWPTNHVVNI